MVMVTTRPCIRATGWLVGWLVKECKIFEIDTFVKYMSATTFWKFSLDSCFSVEVVNYK
jgi:hypothetical protein